MDDKDLDKLLSDLPIPEPSVDARKQAMQAARQEMEKALKEAPEKEIKGFAHLVRLMGKAAKKLFSSGGALMQRPAVVRSVVYGFSLFMVLGIVAAISIPAFLGQRDKAKYRAEMATESAPGADAPVSSTVPSRTGTKVHEPGQLRPGQYAQADKAASPKTKDAPAVKEHVHVAADEPKPPVEYEIAEEAMPEPDMLADMSASGELRGVAPSAAPLNRPSPAGTMKVEKKQMLAKSYNRRAKGKGNRGMGYETDSIAPSLPEQYVGRDRFEEFKVNPVKVTREAPVSTFSIDVDTASYAFVRRALNSGYLPQKDSVRVEELINYFDYDYAAPRNKSKPFKPTVAVYPSPWDKRKRLLHIGIKGYELERTEKPRSNLVFLLDVSGSMSSPDKLTLLKNSMRMLVENLEAEDTVSIVVYAGAAGVVLEPTTVKDKRKILAALEKLQAGGSTAGGEGIRLAYAMAEQNFDKSAVNRVMLATDGDFNVGIQNPSELQGFVEKQRDKGIYLSVLGFGQGNYNDEMMQRLAQNGNGNAAYIDSLSEARKVLVDEAGATLFTIAKDVKIQVEFNPARVAEYRLIGYETRMLKREDFNNDKVDAGEIGAGHTVTAIYEITPVGSGAELVEGLRYKEGNGEKVKEAKEDKGAEYAFLRIRYKLPKESKSKLIERPIRSKDEFGSIEKAPQEMRFASAVAAFGQVLRGGAYTGEYGYEDIVELARSARGDDEFGYRSEFVSLVRLAMTARDMGTR